MLDILLQTKKNRLNIIKITIPFQRSKIISVCGEQRLIEFTRT